MRSIPVFLYLIMVSNLLLGQVGFGFGIITGAGTTFTQIAYDFKSAQYLRQKRGYSIPVGVFITYGKKESLSYGIAFQRILKQYIIDRTNNLTNADMRFSVNLDSWTIPLTLKYRYRIPEANNSFIIIDGGLSLDLYETDKGCKQGGAILGSDTSSSEFFHVDYTISQEINVGVRFGLGLEKQVKNHLFSLIIRYSQGTGNLLTGNYYYWANHFTSESTLHNCSELPIQSQPSESYQFRARGDFLALELTYAVIISKKEKKYE